MRTVSELAALYRRVTGAFGFDAFAFGFVPGPGASQTFLLLDWPRAWLELYAAQGFAARDAVVAEAARTARPFTWSDLRGRDPEVSRDIFEAAEAFGWRDGFTVPVHGPGEERGVVSLAAPSLDLSPASREGLAAISLIAFERAREFGGFRPRGPDALTARERETLALVAAGFPDAEIGERLGISTATAHFHVEQAKRRLGARTRAHAVALALGRGLLAP